VLSDAEWANFLACTPVVAWLVAGRAWRVESAGGGLGGHLDCCQAIGVVVCVDGFRSQEVRRIGGCYSELERSDLGEVFDVCIEVRKERSVVHGTNSCSLPVTSLGSRTFSNICDLQTCAMPHDGLARRGHSA
jgi:hypothetical protein